MYFSAKELQCHCGECDDKGDNMDVVFMEHLDQLRRLYGKPIILSSAYRCPKYNAKISSTGSTGPHTTGKAVDIVISGVDAYKLLSIAMKLEYFTGIGIKQSGGYNKRFIHLDSIDDNQYRPMVWSY